MMIKTQETIDNDRMNSKENNIFLPKKSLGWLSLLILLLLCSFFTWAAFLAYQQTESFGALISIILFVILSITMLLLFIWFFSIKYVLIGDKLIVSFGPFNYEIDLYMIEKVEQRSLTPALKIGFIVPGFAKWVVSYKDEGNLFMCSTRAMKNIVVLHTKKGKIGITPAKDQEFIEEINSRIRFMKFLVSE